MRDGVGQGEGAAPAAAKNVHLAVDVQLVAQRRHVVDQVLGRIVDQRRCCVIIARTGRALAATALVEKHDAVSLRIENRADEPWLPAPGPPCMTMTGSPASEPYSSQ
jgi:hypothetical protein